GGHGLQSTGRSPHGCIEPPDRQPTFAGWHTLRRNGCPVHGAVFGGVRRLDFSVLAAKRAELLAAGVVWTSLGVHQPEILYQAVPSARVFLAWGVAHVGTRFGVGRYSGLGRVALAISSWRCGVLLRGRYRHTLCLPRCRFRSTGGVA